MLSTNVSASHGHFDTALVPKIAIIGAGITGASTAHHLHKFCRLYHPLDITVFESEPKVGGRIKSAYIHNEVAYDIESGATSFSDADWCMKSAMQEVGLRSTSRTFLHQQIGVWDGHEIVVSYAKDDRPLTTSWWRSPKWLWRYGQSLQSLRHLIATNGKSFSDFVSTGYTLKLVELLQESFGYDVISLSALSYFEQRSINEQLLNEIVRAESRYRHACDSHEIDALSATLVLRSAPEIAIYQGNQRLPHRMLKISEAETVLNTRVSHISPGQTRRWKLHTQSTTIDDAPSIEEEFDIIIITSSFANSDIRLDPLPSTLVGSATVPSYAKRHVTLFSTLEALSPSYFGLPDNSTLPEKILTAPKRMSQPGMSSEEGSSDYSKDGFPIYSVAVVARVPPADAFDSWDQEEYVYKIVSSRSVPDTEIASMLGHQMNNDNHLEDLGVTWVHRQEWAQACPKFPRDGRIVDNLEIAPDLYYTAPATELYNTMEMGCRTGLNLAKHLYYSKWTGELYP